MLWLKIRFLFDKWFNSGSIAYCRKTCKRCPFNDKCFPFYDWLRDKDKLNK